MDDSLGELRELWKQHVELVKLLEAAADQPAVAQLETLRELLTLQRAVGDATKNARSRLEREWSARSERQRVQDLRSGPDPTPTDVALAILRGDLSAAREGLARAVAPFTALMKSLIKPLNALIEGGPPAIKHLESAMHRLRNGEDRLAMTRELRGALMVQLGRLYREELQSDHLATGAFREAAKLLRGGAEPLVERAELLRRAGRLDQARSMFLEASRIAAHRAGAWIGLSLIAEARGATEEAEQHAARAAEVVALDDDPLSVLRSIQPAPCKIVLVAIARIAKADGRVDLARRAYATVIRNRATIEPTLPDLLVEMARLTEPPDARALCEAARLLCWRGTYEPAIALLREATGVGDSNFAASAYLADALRLRALELPDTERTEYLLSALGRSTEAIEHASLGEGDAWMLITHARIVQTLVDDETRGDDALWEALLHCEHALVLEPRSPACLTRTARLHHAVGNPITARLCAKAAVIQAPQDPDAVSTLVWILSVGGEFDEAKELIARLPDSAWRRGAEAYIRIREHIDDASLEVAKSLLIVPASDKLMKSWQPVSLGLCLLLLRDQEGAREQFLAARASSRLLDQIDAAIFLEDFRHAIELGEAQSTRLRYHTDENLIAALTIAHLAIGDVARAEIHFERLCRFLRGPIARNWAITFDRDIRLLTTFQELPEPAVGALKRMVATLLELADAEERRASPACRELETSLKETDSKLTDTEREALRLAYLRTALVESQRLLTENPKLENPKAVHHLFNNALIEVQALPDSRRGRAARARAVASALVTAASGPTHLLATALNLGPELERLPELLTSAGQCAQLISAAPGLWEVAPIVTWISRHLGMAAPHLSLGIPPITLAIADDLIPATANEDRLVNVVIPKVRSAIEDQYGAIVPGMTIRRLHHVNECRLYVRGRRVGTLDSLPEIPSDTEEALGTWIRESLLNHLALLVGVDDTIAKIDTISEVTATDHDARLITDSGGLLRLWRLVRGLLKEHVPLVPWRHAAHAARTGRGLPFEAMLNRARRYLNDGLCSELARRLDPGTVVEVPQPLARSVVAHVGLEGTRAYFAATPQDTASLLQELMSKLGADNLVDPIFRVPEPDARSWIQQLIQLECPSAMILTDDEFVRYGEWVDRRKTT